MTTNDDDVQRRMPISDEDFRKAIAYELPVKDAIEVTTKWRARFYELSPPSAMVMSDETFAEQLYLLDRGSLAEVAEQWRSRTRARTDGPPMEGDIVEPREGVDLTSGCSWYGKAIVLEVDPFTLVSGLGDMVWSATVRPENFRVIGRATDEQLAAVVHCKRKPPEDGVHS